MKIHLFTDTGSAYDGVQGGTSQDGGAISTGDIVLVESEKVVGIATTWPFALTVEHGKLHSVEPAAFLTETGPVVSFGPYVLRAAGQAILRGWPVREEMMSLLSKAKTLTCCCCGEYHKGRQWHNRDDGYGLCNGCIDTCVTDPLDFLTTACSYGVPGIHYDVTGEHYRSKLGKES